MTKIDTKNGEKDPLAALTEAENAHDPEAIEHEIIF